MTETTMKVTDLGEVNGNALLTHIPEPLAVDTPNFQLEYGIRVDDQAMVFHFYPPKEVGGWYADYQMDKRLERAILRNFKTDKTTAGYAEELSSFYVIVEDLGRSPDPWTLSERFIVHVQEPLEGGT